MNKRILPNTMVIQIIASEGEGSKRIIYARLVDSRNQKVLISSTLQSITNIIEASEISDPETYDNLFAKNNPASA